MTIFVLSYLNCGPPAPLMKNYLRIYYNKIELSFTTIQLFMSLIMTRITQRDPVMFPIHQ